MYPVGHANKHAAYNIAERGSAQVEQNAAHRNCAFGANAHGVEQKAGGQEEHVGNAVLEAAGD